jgi:hypothetical protein
MEGEKAMTKTGEAAELATLIVCSVSPIPSDDVTIAHVEVNVCPGVWPHAWTIERLTAATDE